MSIDTLERPGTNITPAIRKDFEALTGGEYDNFVLFSAFVNGEPCAAICVQTMIGDDYVLAPIFVSITPGMVLTDHDGMQPSKQKPNIA